VKKRPRAKGAPRSKPERKPKGAKGPPKSKSGGKGKAPEKKPAVHPEPTEHAGPGKLDLMYGGFTLRLHDHDKKGAPPAVYEGKLRDVIFPCEKPIPVPAATSSGSGPAAGSCTVTDGNTQLIAKLQRDLWSLGFWVFPREIKDDVVQPAISGVFDWRTEWAVREFQIAAAMPNVAVQDVRKEPTEAECRTTGKYLSSLSATKNACDFKGSPNGAVDEATRAALKFWLANNYRCPLVIQAMKRVEVEPAPKRKKSKKTKAWVVDTENLWQYDEVPHTAQRMFAWDFSGHYQLPSGRSNENIAVGRYAIYSSWGGPASYPGEGQCWDEAQLSPAVVTGIAWEDMDESQKSTFRAIAAVGSVECQGFLDSVNFYDNCHGSAGPCHWTMPKSDGSGGEYCGFMALFEAKHCAAFERCFADLGLWGPRWSDSTSNDGRPEVTTGSATYGGYVYTKGADGKFEQHPSKHRSFAETNWLRSWQWTYRLEMAARTSEEYRATMWEYARLRIQGIRSLDQVHDWLPSACKPKGGSRVTVGDVITSEQGTAALLRLHVRWSGALSASSKGKKGKAKPILHDAVQRAIRDKGLKDSEGHPLTWETTPDQWNTEHEVALVEALLHCTGALGSADQQRTVGEARYWPLAVRNGKIIEKEVTVGTEKKKRFVLASTASWIPDRKNPADYAPDDERGSFTLSG
jgi:hypothetical protein